MGPVLGPDTPLVFSLALPAVPLPHPQQKVDRPSKGDYTQMFCFPTVGNFFNENEYNVKHMIRHGKHMVT